MVVELDKNLSRDPVHILLERQVHWEWVAVVQQEVEEVGEVTMEEVVVEAPVEVVVAPVTPHMT